MKRTTIAYLLVTVLGVALFAVGLLNVQSHFLPMAASDVMAPLGGASSSAWASGACGADT